MTSELEDRVGAYVQALDRRAADQAAALERRAPLDSEVQRSSGRGVFIALASVGAICLAAIGVQVLGGDGRDALVEVVDSHPDSSGGQEDPRGDWDILPVGPLVPPEHGAAVWLGDELLVVGDSDASSDELTPAAAFRPATQEWREIAPVPVPLHEVEAATATNDGLVVVGTRVTGFTPNAPELELVLLRYEAASDEWSMAPVPRGGQSYYERLAIAWTGTEVVLWGYDLLQDQPPLATAYDPANDAWRSIDPGPLTYRNRIGFAWTGSELVVLGGDPDWIGEIDPLGAAYDPTLDSWRTIPASPIHTDLHLMWPEVVWTGSEIILWDGSMPADQAGARYNPATDEWAPMAPDPFPSGVLTPTVVWAGDRLLVVDGWSEGAGVSAAYDPVRDEWTTIEDPPGGGGACGSVAVWADDITLLWGGNVGCGRAHQPRANLLAYRPAESAAADPDPIEVDEELQADIDEALVAAEPSQRPLEIPIGEPWSGSVSTSDGPQELTVARTVGDRRDGDGFCVSACYGAGFSQDLDEPRIMNVTVPGTGSLEPDEPARAVFWVPHDANELTIRWDDETITTAETVQPFGPGTVRVTVVAIPDGVETGMFSTGSDEHAIDVAVPTGP